MDAREIKQEEVFLLRKWRSAKTEPWRFSLKSITTGEIHFFHRAESMMDYLIEKEIDIPQLGMLEGF